jgi:cob(I)alamin adenosyltransferase
MNAITGKVHLYTGNGKGKTTAAIGLAIRALGAGKKVFIGQFVKGMIYSEIDLCLSKLDNIDVELFGSKCFINRQPNEEDITLAQNGLKRIKEVLADNSYNLVILDEVTIAIYFKLINELNLIDLLKSKQSNAEIVLTGRYASQHLIDFADLVTDMREVKHYYSVGISSRKGIEF